MVFNNDNERATFSIDQIDDAQGQYEPYRKNSRLLTLVLTLVGLGALAGIIIGIMSIYTIQYGCFGDPCQNGGECETRFDSDSYESFECSCVDGFTGSFCEHKNESNHLLYLNTNGQDLSLIFNENGNTIDTGFTIGENAYADQSCSTVLNGEAIIFGGLWGQYYRQISVVSGCSLLRIGDLPFDFQAGTCGTFNMNAVPSIFLCFDQNARRKCRILIRKNGGSLGDINDFIFEEEFEIDSIPDTKYDHWLTSIANYQGYPLILGDNSGHSKVEMFDKNNNQWIEGTDYPYATIISGYSVVSTPSNVIYFGGFGGFGASDIVAEYKDHTWTQLGTLNQQRKGHSSIQMDNKIFILGGYNGDNVNSTEIWQFKNDDLESNNVVSLAENGDYYGGVLLRFDVGQCNP